MQIIKEAGISGTDASKLLKVSRVTVSYWLTGRCKPNRWLKNDVELFLKSVETALAKGDLPIPKGASQDERLAKYKAILDKHRPNVLQITTP